ncbi:DUF825 domain-containing protein, partial [Mycobacterium tuberculosis]|nr:DUF825 domain-containing protein [Mycobacterium tuberculosis]
TAATNRSTTRVRRAARGTTRVLPITKKYIMPEFNWDSRWWRNWIGKKSDSSCPLSNSFVGGGEESLVTPMLASAER